MKLDSNGMPLRPGDDIQCSSYFPVYFGGNFLPVLKSCREVTVRFEELNDTDVSLNSVISHVEQCGAAAFLHVHDVDCKENKTTLYVRPYLGKTQRYKWLRDNLTIGTKIFIEGTVFKTRTDEPMISVNWIEGRHVTAE